MIAANVLKNMTGKAGEFRPRHELIEVDKHSPLSKEDKPLVTNFMVRMKMDKLVLLPNFDSRALSLSQPSGFVATIHAQSPFQYEAFVGHALFRGMARIRVQMPEDLGDEDKARMRRALNVFIRDESHNPPRVHAPNKPTAEVHGGWTASLGPAGYIRLDKCGFDLFERPQYWLIVVAGLPSETYDDLDRHLQLMSQNENYTMADAWLDETNTIALFRHLAKMNRSRLLADACNALGLQPFGEDAIHKDVAFDHVRLDGEDDKFKASLDWLREQDLGRVGIPASYVLPRLTPKECSKPLPEFIQGFALGCAAYAMANTIKFPHYFADTHDVVFNDVFDMGEKQQLIVYSSACCTKQTGGIPYILGPGELILIYNPETYMAWHNLFFNAFPTEGRFVVNTPGSAQKCITFENSQLAVCRMAIGTWIFDEPVDPSTEVKVDHKIRYNVPPKSKCLICQPLIVRVAAVDSNGWAMPTTKTGRWNLVDDEYVGI